MVKMYCIEFINKHGVRDWLGNIFYSVRAAQKFANRHVAEIGTRFTIKGV